MNKTAFFDKIDYQPHEGQRAFHDSPARFKIACCGRRYGKSTMSARDVAPELFLPDKRFWIIGPTYDLGEKEFRIIWDDLMIKQGLAKDKRIKKAYKPDMTSLAKMLSTRKLSDKEAMSVGFVSRPIYQKVTRKTGKGIWISDGVDNITIGADP